MGVKGMCKAVIQLIKVFHDLLKDIFPKVLPTQEKAMPTKRCVECYKHSRRKETVLVLCQVGLRVQDCFDIFHTNFSF